MVLRSAIALGSRVAYLYLPSRQMHFSIRFGQERRVTLEIRVKVKEFPRLSFLPEGYSGKILD